MPSAHLPRWLGSASAALCVALTSCPKSAAPTQQQDTPPTAERSTLPGSPSEASATGGHTAPPCEAADDTGESDGAEFQPHVIALWPPNHKLHEVEVRDCLTARDACGHELEAELIWASSDEPEDDKGDGNRAPDILLGGDCEHIALRAERRGNSDGRVYTLGVRVATPDGTVRDTQCSVVVPHDQGQSSAVDSGEAYRIHFTGSDAAPRCGQLMQPPAPEMGEPDDLM